MPFKPELATNLGGLADMLGELASVPSRAAGAIADDLTELTDERFSSETDAYGESWEALEESTILKKGHDRILQETGTTRAESLALPLRGAGIELRSSKVGFFHQAGTVHHPARKFFPDGESLPVEYKDAIDRRLAETFATTTKKRGRRA